MTKEEIFNERLKYFLTLSKKLVKQNQGVLPGYRQLKREGFLSLYNFKKRYPKYFSHIEVESVKTRIERRVKIVEKLTKQNGGFLPSQTWMCKNGYKYLCDYMRTHPKPFSHFKKVSELKIKNKILIAEKLVKENGGLLPNTLWLQNNGYKYLDQYIRENPYYFKHIIRERGKRGCRKK